MNDLWIPPRARDNMQAEFRKTPSPRTGPAFGAWAGRDLQYMQLPGGAAMQFDLSKLQLSDYREMRNHYQVGYNQLLMLFMIHQGDWSIECKDKTIAKTVEEIVRPVWTKLIRSLSQALWAGFSPSVIEWDNEPITGRVVATRFKDLVPEECSVHWKEVIGAPTQPGQVPQKLYYYDGIEQHAFGYHGSASEIEPLYTLWYPLLMENGDYYGRKLLKPAFIPWFFSTLVHLFANRYFERFGEPTPIGRYDQGATLTNAAGNEITGQDAIFEILQNLRSRGVVALPNDSTDFGNGTREYDFDIKYLESQMRGADFERYLLRLDEEISLGMFTPISVSHVGENASHNTVQVHMQAYLWSLNALMGDMKEYIDEFFVNRIKDLNFGPKAPRCEWVPRQLGKDNVETLRAIVSAGMARTTDWSYKVDPVELGTALGVKVEEVEIIAPPPALPGGGPKPASGDSRVNRQKPAKPKIAKSAGAIRQKVAARVKKQAEKAHFAHVEEFRPDWGFRKQLEETTGDPDTVAAVYGRLDTWAAEAWPLCADHREFGTMLDRVLESQFES